jgi:hypothetical protein
VIKYLAGKNVTWTKRAGRREKNKSRKERKSFHLHRLATSGIIITWFIYWEF